jgi:hypothetical protein
VVTYYLLPTLGLCLLKVNLIALIAGIQFQGTLVGYPGLLMLVEGRMGKSETQQIVYISS